MVSGAGARAKGHQWERDAVNDFKEIDPSAKRNLEYQEGMGYDISTNLPYRIQCKCQKQINWLKALGEADNGDESVMPVVAGKVTGKGKYAFMKWSDFIQLVKWAHMDL